MSVHGMISPATGQQITNPVSSVLLLRIVLPPFAKASPQLFPTPNLPHSRTMQKRSSLLLIALLGAALPALPATIDANKWYHITIANSVNASNASNSNPAGTYFDPGAGPWTFNLISAGTLEVTDADFNGDYVSVRDNGTAFTPNPQGPIFDPGANCGLNPTACLANPQFWHLTVALTAKAYSLTFVGLDTPLQTSSVFFRVTGTIDNGSTPPPPPPPPVDPPPVTPDPSSIPEPTTYALCGSAFAALAWLKGRKR